MLTRFIEKAMSHAVYEMLEDGSYTGCIPDCAGAVAFAETLYACQEELKETLEGWLIIKIRHGDILPVIDGLDLNQGIPKDQEAAACG